MAKIDDFDTSMDIDSGVDLDLGDLGDISLEELDKLGDIDLGDLDLDEIDFDDIDILNLTPKAEKKVEDTDFNLDQLINETDPGEVDDKDDEITTLLSNKDDVFSDADSEFMNDIGMSAVAEPEELTEPLYEQEEMTKPLFEEEKTVPVMDDNSTGVDLFAAFDNSDFDANSGGSDAGNMDLDDLFSALGIDNEESGEKEENYTKSQDSLDDLFEAAAMNMDESLLNDIDDISAEDEPGKKKKKKAKYDENGNKIKRSISEILFGEPDEDDIAEEKELLIKKEQKKAKKEEQAALKAQKEEEKKAALEKKNKGKEKLKKEKAEKKQAELDAYLEEERNSKQVPTPVVIIVFLVFALVGGLVYFGSENFHYSQVIRKAADYFERQRYRLAYDEVAGVDVKEKDEELRDRIYTVMYVERLYESYENNMKLARPDKALDALLRGIEKYDEHYDEAVELDIVDDIDTCRAKIIKALSGFGVSESRAYALIALDGQEYAKEIVEITEDYKAGE